MKNPKAVIQTLIWYALHTYYIERKIISRKLYLKLEILFTHLKWVGTNPSNIKGIQHDKDRKVNRRRGINA